MPRVVHGDCREVMAGMDAESVDAIVTDPPYGLSFMGKDWDHGMPGEPFWREALRVVKPGAHLLAFGGTRTFHRLACAIEDAGWEIRDCVMWVYGEGFPKSHNVGKAIDKIEGNEREVVGEHPNPAGNKSGGNSLNMSKVGMPVTATLTKGNSPWEGWGTALKPAWEPIIVARKPMAGTVAENVGRYGTGALNVDGCRIPATGRPLIESRNEASVSAFGDGLNGSRYAGTTDTGRWPANLAHDGSEEVMERFPQSESGEPRVPSGSRQRQMAFGMTDGSGGFGDTGSAARFFYCAKASRSERGEANNHPTVKPIALMRWLCRLVTPPGGLILDPFAGSGSTLIAARAEGFRAIGIEQDENYVSMATGRLALPLDLFEVEDEPEQDMGPPPLENLDLFGGDG